MKRILSLMLVLIMCLSTANVFAAEEASRMQEALVNVKSRIDIPKETENFESGSRSVNGRTYYDFYWHDDNHDTGVTVQCDAMGRISSYYSYINMKEESPQLTLIDKARVFEAADSFMRKALPELFEKENDCLVYNEDKSTGRLNYNNTGYTFVYERIHEGIPVAGNTAYITAEAYGEYIHISAMNCTWYYDAEFEALSDFEGDISAKYFEQYPLEIVYHKQYDYRPVYKAEGEEKVVLMYRFKDGVFGYISAENGEKVTPDSTDGYGVVTESSAEDKAMMSGAGGANRAQLTEKELKELEQVSGLMTQAEAEKMLKNFKELNIGDLKTRSFSVNKYQEKYYLSINMSSEDTEGKSHYFNGSLDGKTGEIQSLYNHIYGSANTAKKDFVGARNTAEAFAKKAAPEKIKETVSEEVGEESAYVRRTRVVNGVKYIDNGINVSADVYDKHIVSYNLNWDEDVSGFASPDEALGEEKAYGIVSGIAPIEPVYVLSGGKFIKCFKADYSGDPSIDAITGELVNKPYEYNTAISYSDIGGHWCENMAKSLAEVGIGLERAELKPDDAIVQADFMRLMLCTFRTYSTYRVADADNIYQSVVDMGIISEEERDDNAPVSREDAFYYMIKFMGYEKIAEMDIFRSDFSDSGELSSNRVGSAALLTGFGVVNGDDGALRAKDSITSAETVALVYNYLIKN